MSQKKSKQLRLFFTHLYLCFLILTTNHKISKSITRRDDGAIGNLEENKTIPGFPISITSSQWYNWKTIKFKQTLKPGFPISITSSQWYNWKPKTT